MTYGDTPSAAGLAAEGTVTAGCLVFLTNMLDMMTPFLILGVILIIVDLNFGIPAAKMRGDKVTLSRAIRKTINKVVEYTCWIVLASSLAVAFDYEPLNWIVLAVVIGNEMISIITNFFTLKGKQVHGLHSTLIRWIGDKLSVDTSDIHIEDTPVKPKKKTVKSKKDERPKTDPEL